MSDLQLSAIRNAAVSREPYKFLLASDFLDPKAVPTLRAEFPAISKPGYLFIDEVNMSPRFKQFVAELEGPEVTEVLSTRFGVDLRSFPRLTTIMSKSQRKYGAIHTDGPSKVLTMLVYMNDEWESGEGGRLRVLYNSQSFEPFACEVPPVMGTVFAFLRSDESWHGHLPFVGERKVVQVAWVKSQKDVDRKRKHNKLAQIFKGVFGR